ncbi:hypothetical protein [Veillonella sp. 3310]|uniref:hypothetical protein n=1 Tax=Veillonella sp. 3310 TaxID=2490956 RepID=UPI000FD69D89|nr:hypothetical protein [Veillonella sp. 3310]
MFTLFIIIVSACYFGVVFGAIIKFKEKNVCTVSTILFSFILPFEHFFLFPKHYFKDKKNISLYKRIRIVLTTAELLPIIITGLAETLVMSGYTQVDEEKQPRVLEGIAKNQYDEIYGTLCPHCV